MSLPGHLFYWLRRLADPPDFVVSFGDAGPRLAKGRLAPRWLDDAAAVADAFNIRSGHVEGVHRAGALRLRFSPAIPRASQQRFRNVFGALHQAGR